MASSPTNHHNDTDHRPRRWLKVIVVVGALELPLLAWLWLAPAMQPKRFTNHTDQITAALRQQGFSVSQVYLEQGWPDRINNQTYGANLSIYLSNYPGTNPVIGRMECRVQNRDCWYQVAKLNIEREALTDLLPPAPPAKPELTWQQRAREILARLGIRLQ